MAVEFIRKLFRHKRSGWMSFSEYFRRHERDLKRHPGRIAQEREQARQWSPRVANRDRAEKNRG